jgi:transposase
MVVSDNLKSGITKACFYEPAVNRAYAEMAAHYGTAIVPARPRKPRDTAKVEVAVQVATRWIIAKLRNRRFFSLPELNAAIRESLVTLNDRVSRHLGASRCALFDATDRSALKPLPTASYVYAEWKQCKAGLDYHVEVEKHYYSVPHALLRETLWARITARTIELFHQGKSRRRPCALVIQPPPHDSARTYAVQPPALCRLDAGTHPATGERDRAEDIGADRDHSARANASGARLSRHDRYPAARLQLRS